MGTEDDPAFAGMHEASARVVGGSLDVAQAVWRGEAAHGVNFSGGLHHAMAERACGFCVYNDIAVAIRWLLDNGAERVAYVDVDVHHGDGVQEIFWDDPRVLTISVHESGRMLFPGTGFPAEIGGAGARGHGGQRRPAAGHRRRAVAAGHRRRRAAAGPRVPARTSWSPSTAATPTRWTRWPTCRCRSTAQRAAAVALHDLAHEVCDGRWVALGGGGYAVVEVVPRTWTHLVAHRRARPDRPGDRRARRPGASTSRSGSAGPGRRTMGDGTGQPGGPRRRARAGGPGPSGVDPEDPVDRASWPPGEAVFPLHGWTPGSAEPRRPGARLGPAWDSAGQVTV